MLVMCAALPAVILLALLSTSSVVYTKEKLYVVTEYI